MNSSEVRQIRPADTLELRRLVLRAGQPADSAVLPGDDDPETWHFGAFRDGACIGVASVYTEARSGLLPPGYRLRGMATDPRERGRGVGTALISAVVDHVAGLGGGELWCNARSVAIGFYERTGFEVVSDPFEIAGIGTHVVMRRLVGR